jgi:hypothetical protein
VAKAGQVGFLATCDKLQTLSLTGTPAAAEPNYKSEIARHLPNLQTLDGQPLPKGNNQMRTAFGILILGTARAFDPFKLSETH